VLQGGVDPAQGFLPGERGHDCPELGSPLAARQRLAQRAQVAADCFELAEDCSGALFVELAVRPLAQLSEPVERRPGGLWNRRGLRLENRESGLARFVQIADAAERAGDLGGNAETAGKVGVGHCRDRLNRQPADAREVVVNVVARSAELLQVGAHRLRGNPGLSQRRHGRPRRALRQLPAIRAEDEPVVDVLRRARAEGLVEPAVHRLVRAVVVPAHDVRDLEVDVVDDAREVVGRRPVLSQQGEAVETSAERLGRFTVALLPAALPDRPLLPFDPEPPEVVKDRLLPARQVASGIRVVNPQEHPLAEPAIGDGAERVADVERAGRTGREADAGHRVPKLAWPLVDEALLAWYDEHRRDLPWRRTRDPYAVLVSEVMLQQTQVERVIPRYETWLERWPSVDALAAAPAADVIREWQGLGYNRRAVNLHRAAQQIAEQGWPEDLTELPGVGRYTADAVRSFALDAAVLPIDTNVRRVQERTGHRFDWRCGQALMDLGARVCLARVPRCGVCPLAGGCPSRGRRYEPLRRQSRLEGSFRQRRARTLREVAAEPRTLSALDAEAVSALERDGLVRVDGELVTLP